MGQFVPGPGPQRGPARASFRGDLRSPGPPPAAGSGPQRKKKVKIADFVKDSSKNRKVFGALRAHIVVFLHFCGRRAPIFLGLEIWTGQ